MSTYSPSLKITLIADGDQAGTWGQTTNTNLGTLLEQAITGVVSITMTDADYTLTDFNGVSDEARNAVIVASGVNTGVRDIIAPSVNKLYTVKNSTSGGYAIRIKTAAGAAITVPNGISTTVYCNGTDFYEQKTGTNNSFSIGGNATVGGTLGVTGAVNGTTAVFSGAISSVSPSFTGTPTVPTAAPGTNTTQAASTAFTNAAVTAGLGTLGTMATQNANNVNISGGTITGSYGLTATNVSGTVAVANGGTGSGTASGARTNLGLGSIATQDSSNVSISGGSVTGVTLSSGNASFTGTPTAPTAVAGTNTTQIATTAFVGTAVSNRIPTGIISLWYGSIVSIPSGWALCDGTNGTPDLRNRFVIGAGNSYAVAATGGSKDAIVVSHTHTANSVVTDPGHSHTGGQTSGQGVGGNGGSWVTGPANTGTSTTGISVSTSITSTGSSGTNANLPPYYALAYIMKL